jgi:hypothetical protein
LFVIIFKVSKLIPKIIGHPKKQLLYIVKIHENTYSAASNWPKKRLVTPKLMVGSVIVYENRIIGKAGIKVGEPHEMQSIQ